MQRPIEVVNVCINRQNIKSCRTCLMCVEVQQPCVICMSFNQNKHCGWPFLIALRSGAGHVESEAADFINRCVLLPSDGCRDLMN